jgi:hypothetical protein
VRRSLLETVHGLIARTYGGADDTHDVASFVIGDEGYRRLTAEATVLRTVGSSESVDAPGPCLLVRPIGDATALALYFPDALIGRLEERPPTRVLDDLNAADFADFTEEIDHFAALSDALQAGRDVSLLELELRANVSKTMVLAHFLARLLGRSRLRTGERLWIRHQVFERRDCAEDDPELRQRYRDARRLAVRLLDRLEPMAGAERLAALRSWNALSGPEKLRQLGA